MNGLELSVEKFLLDNPRVKIETVAYAVQKEPGKEITSPWGYYSCAIFYKDS